MNLGGEKLRKIRRRVDEERKAREK